MKLETLILTNLLNDETYLRKTLPFLNDEYFINETERKIIKAIKTFVDAYNNPPSPEALIIIFQNDKSLTEKQYAEAIDILSTLEYKAQNAEWLLAETEKFCKDKALYNAIFQSIQIINGKDNQHTSDGIPDLLKTALAISFDNSVGHDYLSNSDERFEFYHRTEEKIPFDLETFNIITKGGLPNKTLNIALAGTGVGKSLFMCHVASGALTQGKNVLYITMEMAEERIAERIDANLMNVTIDDLALLPKQMFDNRIARIKNKTQGRLVIKEYPTSSAHSGHFRALLHELQLKKEFRPDIIFIDYLNICSSSRLKMSGNVNSYTYIKSIAEELRGLAVEFNVPIVSATQTTRGGFCLDPNTVVVTKNGKKLLKEVAVGDILLSKDCWNEVRTVFSKTSKKMYKITTESGKQIICSEDHLFPTEQGEEKNIRNGLCLADRLLIRGININ